MPKTIADRISQIESLLAEILTDWEEKESDYSDKIERLEDRVRDLESELDDKNEKLEQALALAEVNEE